MELSEWIERYRRAWVEADDEAVATLFAEDATYRSSPFRNPHRGRAEIREYWRQATATQGRVEVAMGRPVVDGERVVVEWWTQMDDAGSELTLPGALLLDFGADGLCTSLREYYNLLEGERRPPHVGWGT